MSAEYSGTGGSIADGQEADVRPSGQVGVVRPDVIVQMDTSPDSGSQQAREDAAVAAELRRLVLLRLPDDGNVGVYLCDGPEVVGTSRQALAAAMEEAYSKAGIGARAEGMHHFEKLWRGYAGRDHGPLRLVIIKDNGERIWVFCDYFDAFDNYRQLGDPYEPAAAAWKQRTGLAPGIYVMSKLVNTQNLATDQRHLRLAAGLGARVFASVVQGLANANEQGMLLAGNAQVGTRNFVLRHLAGLLTGRLEVVFDKVEDGVGDEASQAQMVIHVQPASKE